MRRPGTARSTRVRPGAGSRRRTTCSTAPRRWRPGADRPKALHLGGFELAPRAGLEPFERERSVAAAMQVLHAVADRFDHPPHLAVAPFVDRQLDRCTREPPNLRR